MATKPESGLQARPRHRMIDRMASTLERVARAPDGLTLTEIATALEAPVSSIQGLVNGLVATGYLEERARRYTLGTAPYFLNLVAGRRVVSSITHEELEAIHEETGLTTVLSIAVGQDVFYVDHSSLDPRFNYLVDNYVRRSLIATSGGWVLLADMDRRDLWAYLTSLPESDGWRVERFLKNLPSIQETGICASPQTSDQHDGVSIAVREHGRTVAAVGILGAPEEISMHADKLAAVLAEHRKSWRPQ